jgi:hypothetical protein
MCPNAPRRAPAGGRACGTTYNDGRSKHPIPPGRAFRYVSRITRRQRLLLNLLITMKTIRSKSFTACPWGALDIANGFS